MDEDNDQRGGELTGWKTNDAADTHSGGALESSLLLLLLLLFFRLTSN